MTYTMECKCGSKFSFASCDEGNSIQVMATLEADRFRAMHKGCCDTIETNEALPEEWKV